MNLYKGMTLIDRNSRKYRRSNSEIERNFNSGNLKEKIQIAGVRLITVHLDSRSYWSAKSIFSRSVNFFPTSWFIGECIYVKIMKSRSHRLSADLRQICDKYKWCIQLQHREDWNSFIWKEKPFASYFRL